MSIYQLFPALDSATEAALTDSIRRFGVLVPVARDQHGNTLDGHQRSRIADALNVDYRVDVHVVKDEDEAREIARTLNADRRQLTVEQRREVVASLREQGHSLRAIAGAVGVDAATVHRDLSSVADATVPDRIVGRDGKSRPAKRSVVAARDTREADRAQQALAAIETPPARVIDVKRAERIAREQQAETKRSKPITPSTDDDIIIEHGDFAEVLAYHDLSDAVVISDPPYPREFLPVWEAMPEVLNSANILVLMTGQSILVDVLSIFDCWRNPDADEYMREAKTDRWHYRWCGAYLTPGPATRVWSASIGSSWKPILVFDRGHQRDFVTRDVFTSEGDDKRHHHWGQNEQGIAQLVETFTKPGGLVVDPFLGGGTTAVVCRDLGRRFIGCDVDAAAVHSTLERLAA